MWNARIDGDRVDPESALQLRFRDRCAERIDGEGHLLQAAPALPPGDPRVGAGPDAGHRGDDVESVAAGRHADAREGDQGLPEDRVGGVGKVDIPMENEPRAAGSTREAGPRAYWQAHSLRRPCCHIQAAALALATGSKMSRSANGVLAHVERKN
jgi:hypothetical protein